MELVGFALSGALVYLAVHIWPNPPTSPTYQYYATGFGTETAYKAK